MSSSKRYNWKFKLEAEVEALQPPLFRLSTTHDSLSRLSTRQILHRHTEISACPRNVKFRPWKAHFCLKPETETGGLLGRGKKWRLRSALFFFFLRVTGGLKRGHSLEEPAMIRTCLVFVCFLGVSDKVPGVKWFLLLRFEIIILGCVSSDIKTNNYVIIRENHPKMNWLKLNSSSKGSCLINPGFKQKSFSFIQDENLKKPLLSKANRSSGQV